MKNLIITLFLSPSLFGQSPDWENPAVFRVNKHPARATTMAFPTKEASTTKARLESPWVQSLNGNWKFHHTGNPAGRPAGFESRDFDDSAWKEIPVPSKLADARL